MTPAIVGLTLAGMSEVSLRTRPSVGHHIARFAALLAVVAYVALSLIGTGGAVG